MGDPYLLPAIAAVVVGGTAFTGGKGSVVGSAIGALFLSQLGQAQSLPIALIPAIKESNDRHRQWALRKIQSSLQGVSQPVVAVLGLAYTPDTNTLRRSAAVELCRQLAAAGVQVRAFDPLIPAPDADHMDLHLSASVADALRGAHAVAVCTESPEFCDYPWRDLLASMARPVVIDANRLVEKAVAGTSSLVYLTVGRP